MSSPDQIAPDKKALRLDFLLGFRHMWPSVSFFPPFDDAVVIRVDGAANPVPPAEIICVIVDKFGMVLIVIGHADQRPWRAAGLVGEVLIA